MEALTCFQNQYGLNTPGESSSVHPIIFSLPGWMCSFRQLCLCIVVHATSFLCLPAGEYFGPWPQ